MFAAAVEEDVGRISGVFRNRYDIIVAAAATGAAERKSRAHDGKEMSKAVKIPNEIKCSSMNKPDEVVVVVW